MPRPGTKQTMLIVLLCAPEGATMEKITAETGWLAHTARGAISGALGKKLGLVVTSANEEGRGRVYRILVSGVCQTSCPPISCGVSDFRCAGIAFRVQPDGSGGLPVAGFS